MLVSGTRYFEGEGMAHVLIISAGIGGMPTAFVALPQILQRNVNWFLKGKRVYVAKVAFEKYFLCKMRKGTTDPVFENMVMSALGI